MSAGGLPYHLRPNKAVERLLFIDLLDRLDPALHFDDDYQYIGFGGPQMEDFRILHERFQGMPMFSLEREQEVLKRQKFNCPHTNLKLLRESSGEYLSRFQAKTPLIVWLDYAEEAERVEQVAEFQTLLRCLFELSVVKLTFNANPANLAGDVKPGLLAERRRKLMEQFARLLPAELPEEALSEERFPGVLLQIVAAASREALASRIGWILQPLSAFFYRDSRQQMFTVTGIVGARAATENTVKDARLRKWHFRNLDWSPPTLISVPELTVKERICINQLLPKCNTKLGAIHRALGFRLDADKSESEAKLGQYVAFHRHYPQFGKIAF
jgi:hypothetical protein